MKLTYFVLVSVALLSSLRGTESVKEKEILAFLEEFRARMCHAIPYLGLPALDPLQITHREVALNNKYLVNFTGSIDDFYLRGLSDFIVHELNIQYLPLLRSTIDISLPFTALKSIYTAKGSLIAYIANLAGDGNAFASAEALRLKISWALKRSTKLGIRGLKLNISLAGIHINFENLLEERRFNDFFHNLVNEMGLELLDDIWSAEQVKVQQLLEDAINAFIGKYTLLDIANIIGNVGPGGEDSPIFAGVPADCKLETNTINDLLMH